MAGDPHVTLFVGIEVSSLKQVLQDNLENNFNVLWSTLFSEDEPNYLKAGADGVCREDVSGIKDFCRDITNINILPNVYVDDYEMIKFMLENEEYEDAKTLLYPIFLGEMKIIHNSMTYSSLCVDDYEITDEHKMRLTQIAEELKLKEWKIKRWIDYWS